MQVLMMSSSKAGNEEFLASGQHLIRSFLGKQRNVLFIPFAGVTTSWDDYVRKIQQALPDFTITGIHQADNQAAAIEQADAILVGGGNTFRLLYELQTQQLLKPLQQAVKGGTPYVGWSAGANICGDSIRTTNDMPIIQPPTFDALKFVPFQLNPHYSDYQPPGFNGETRAQRITEFCVLNPNMPVLAIREGSAAQLMNGKLTLLGDKPAVLFRAHQVDEVPTEADLTRLLEATP